MGRLWIGLVAAGLSPGCASEVVPRTELMLVADTDVNPEKIREMGFTIVDRKGVPKRYGRKNLAYSDLPITFALEHAGGDLGPVKVASFVDTGAADGVFERNHEVMFVPGKTLVVPLHLSAACVAHDPCGEQACTEDGACAPEQLDGLEPWTGQAPRMNHANPPEPEFDASTDPINGDDDGADDGEADASVEPGTQVCDGVTYSRRDDEHCGGCDVDCTEKDGDSGAIMKHVHGVCSERFECVRACVDGFVSCSGPDNLNGNGCETAADAQNTCESCACGG